MFIYHMIDCKYFLITLIICIFIIYLILPQQKIIFKKNVKNKFKYRNKILNHYNDFKNNINNTSYYIMLYFL